MTYKSKLLFCVLIIFLYGCDSNEKDKETYKYTNALINESSPYLLKHAHNPVNWQPWGDSIFKVAEKEKRLVIISIGYSSCHWCTVMEKETFSNDTIAKFMNEHFINVKVDREERPDVDHLYMRALQLINGSGGWPLNMILLPDGKPIYGGTYHTKKEWLSAIKMVDSLYKKNPESAKSYAEQVANGIKELSFYSSAIGSGQTLTKETIHNAVSQWKQNWDREYGGNRGNQKFMLPSSVNFLLDYAVLNEDEDVLSFAELTLDQIALKGVYDHVSGGFFRYSTDPQWEIPHYEKMLYDNAQLVSVFSKAFKIFKKPLYKERIEQTLAFLNSCLKTSAQVYQSALDADLDGKEGAFYTFSEQEIAEAILVEKGLFKSYFNINKQYHSNNSDYHLFKNKTDSLFAKENGITLEKLRSLQAKWISGLMKIRNQKAFPLKDDKIIVSWNALTIEALGDAYAAIGNTEYLTQAEITYHELINKALQNQQLIHSYKKNSKPVQGFLDDYSFLISASLKLYTLTGKKEYLERATALNTTVINNFKVKDSPFFKYNSTDNLIAPIIITNDDVMPSANAVMAKNLFLLSNILYDNNMKEKSQRMVQAMSKIIDEDPASYTYWEGIQLYSSYPFYDVAITGSGSDEFSRELNSLNLPNTLIVFEDSDNNIPIFENRWISDNTLIYICEQRSCKFPVDNVKESLKLMNYQID